MLQRNLASILDDVIHCAEFISLRRDRTTLEKFLQDEETQAMFERKFEVIGEALGLLRNIHQKSLPAYGTPKAQLTFVM